MATRPMRRRGELQSRRAHRNSHRVKRWRRPDGFNLASCQQNLARNQRARATHASALLEALLPRTVHQLRERRRQLGARVRPPVEKVRPTNRTHRNTCTAADELEAADAPGRNGGGLCPSDSRSRRLHASSGHRAAHPAVHHGRCRGCCRCRGAESPATRTRSDGTVACNHGKLRRVYADAMAKGVRYASNLAGLSPYSFYSNAIAATQMYPVWEQRVSPWRGRAWPTFFPQLTVESGSQSRVHSVGEAGQPPLTCVQYTAAACPAHAPRRPLADRRDRGELIGALCSARRAADCGRPLSVPSLSWRSLLALTLGKTRAAQSPSPLLYWRRALLLGALAQFGSRCRRSLVGSCVPAARVRPRIPRPGRVRAVLQAVWIDPTHVRRRLRSRSSPSTYFPHTERQ